MAHDDTKRTHPVDERLMDYVYGELSPDGARAVEARLRTDAAAREEVESLRAVRAAFQALPLDTPAPKVTYDILREARRAAAEREARRRPWWAAAPPLLAHPAFASACVLVLVGGAILALHRTGADRPAGGAGEAGVRAPSPDEELAFFAGDRGTKGETGAATPSRQALPPAKPEAPAEVATEVAAAAPAAPAATTGGPPATDASTRERKMAAPARPGPSKAGEYRDELLGRIDRELSAPTTPVAARGGGGGHGGGHGEGYGGGGGVGLPPGRVFEPAPVVTVEADDDAFGALGGSAGNVAQGLGAYEGRRGEEGGVDDGVAAAPSAMPPPPAGQAQAWASADAAEEEAMEYLQPPVAAQAPIAVDSSEADAIHTVAAGGVRGGAASGRDQAARSLLARMGDLDRLAAGPAWGDLVGEAARSDQLAGAVPRIRRRLAASAPDAREEFARIVRRQIALLEKEGLTDAALALRRLLAQIEEEAVRRPEARRARAKDKAADVTKARALPPASPAYDPAPAAEPADAAKAVGY